MSCCQPLRTSLKYQQTKATQSCETCLLDAIEGKSMRTLTIHERIDQITECRRHRSAAETYRYCDHKARWNCRDSSRCSQCDTSETDLSCGES